MKYVETSPLDRFFTEKKKEEIQKELLRSAASDGFDRLCRMSKAYADDDTVGDDYAKRITEFFCWLIDHDKKDEVCRLLASDRLWGCYAVEEDELAPLCYAISLQKTEIALAMIETIGDDDFFVWDSPYSPGFIALEQHEYDVVRSLLAHGADEAFFAGVYTGLQKAALDMDLEAARFMLEEFGHDVNMVGACRIPPLNLAVENDDLPMVELFLAQPSVDVNQTDENGCNAIELAESVEVQALLLRKGAYPAPETAKLICAAITAVEENDPDTAKFLTKKLVSQDPSGAVFGEFDLLAAAVKYDQYEVTRLIVENGLVDLSEYGENLFSLCRCVYRRDRHERSAEERLRYMRLFDRYGYRFPFPENDYEHERALFGIRDDDGPERKEELAIMRRAGVNVDRRPAAGPDGCRKKGEKDMENLTDYLTDLGYTGEEIEAYEQTWATGILTCLSFHRYNVAENMRFLQPDVDRELLLKLPVFFPDSFALEPVVFKKRVGLLKKAFPDKWTDIIEWQFYAYDGTDAEAVSEPWLRLPFLEIVGMDSDDAAEKAVESLKHPGTRVYLFTSMLEKETGLPFSTDDFPETCLVELEEQRYQLADNVRFLMKRQLSEDLLRQILWLCPSPLLYDSEEELDGVLSEAFGDDYPTEMEEMPPEELQATLSML